jgi:hypothetical protein
MSDPAPEVESDALLPPDSARDLRERWEAIQTRFVDEPRASVERADELVQELLSMLTRTFADERAQLEGQWAGDGEASTEDLRQALQRYRVLFGRLLAA